MPSCFSGRCDAVMLARRAQQSINRCPALDSNVILPYLSVMSTLTITAKGQVTLRKDILKHLGVAPGDRVSVEKLPDGRVEVKAAPTGNISDVFNCLKKPGRRALSVDEMNQIAARGWAVQGRARRK